MPVKYAISPKNYPVCKTFTNVSLLFSSLLCFFLDFLDESESEESEGKNLSVAPRASPKVLELPPDPEGFLLLEGPALLLAGPVN